MYTAKSSRIFWPSALFALLLSLVTPALGDEKADADWWSLQPVQRPDTPKVKNAQWARNPIDAFVLSRLEARGLTPTPEANRRTLIRRLSYDLTGLPPTPAEVSAFITDKAPNAYEKVVDRLLASPHYGERWARHWLDVVHYGGKSRFWV